MKKLLLFSLVTCLFSCVSAGDKKTGKQIGKLETTGEIPIVLSKSLLPLQSEFAIYQEHALQNIREFVVQYGWDSLTREPFMDSVMIFDNKKMFDKTLLKIAGADTTMILPETYCAALENRTLMAVSPEIYAQVYPQGIEDNSYEKLLTHEIAHRLHDRILDGDEDAMGPVWFYEGFAIFAANQFADSDIRLSKEEMKSIMNDPKRGSYLNYGYIFRYFTVRIPLPELIEKAKDKKFNEWLITYFGN